MKPQNTDSALYALRLTNTALDVLLSALEQAADTRPDYESEPVARILCEGAGRTIPDWAKWSEEERAYFEAQGVTHNNSSGDSQLSTSNTESASQRHADAAKLGDDLDNDRLDNDKEIERLWDLIHRAEDFVPRPQIDTSDTKREGNP